jgi:hypothetical protein
LFCVLRETDGVPGNVPWKGIGLRLGPAPSERLDCEGYRPELSIGGTMLLREPTAREVLVFNQ